MRLIAAFLIVAALSGCTVSVEPTDLSSIRLGTDSTAVERILGKPLKSVKSKDLILATYSYDRGGSRKVIRPGTKDSVDVIFLFPLLPIAADLRRQQLERDQKGRLAIIYDSADRIVWFGRFPIEGTLPFSDLIDAYRQARTGDAQALELLSSLELQYVKPNDERTRR